MIALERVRAKRSPQVVSDAAVTRRMDIDGLRALAVLLVVAYHVWTSRVSGGVDVFLMISAYFLTASFVRRVERSAPLALGTYWLERFRRLLPPAAVVLVGVLVAAWALFPQSMWNELWQQTWASLLYMENWYLASTSVDYYARASDIPSALQHFWSLSVQGQVFLLWPILVAVGVFVARQLSAAVRPVLIVVFGLVFAGSLSYSVVVTAENQAFAYFDTSARLWEFALGSLLALLAPWIVLPRRPAAVVGWLGIAALVACGMVLDVGAGFPGYLALWPTLAAAAVIVSGASPSRAGPGGMLGAWPLQRLAAVSYALYLVHWPILIAYRVVTGASVIGLSEGAAIVAVSLALAFAITYGVEQPLQRIARGASARTKRWVSASVIAASALVVALSLTAMQAVVQRSPVGDEDAAVVAVSPHPGAAVIYDDLGDVPYAPVAPAALELQDEWVIFDWRCKGDAEPELQLLVDTCIQVRKPDAVRSVLVLGDSHAQQWSGSLEPIAAHYGWDLVGLILGGCSFAVGEDGSDECREWREAAIGYAVERQPDLIVLMGTKTTADAPDERALAGLEETIERLRPSGASFLLVRDNPRFVDDRYVCVELHGRNADECTSPRSEVLAAENPAAGLAAADVGVVDLTDYLCPGTTCPPVIGNVAVYLDFNHLTATYARTLAPPLSREIATFTGWSEMRE